jgi:Tfp pilus assembly protein PilF
LNKNCKIIDLLLAICAILALFAQTAFSQAASNTVQIVELQGTVEILRAHTNTWSVARTNQILQPFDRIHTAENSRLALRWSDESILLFGASTELEILPQGSGDEQPGLHLIRGIISYFHRDKPGSVRISTRGAVAGVEGTEFVLAVDAKESTTLSVIDGKVTFGNEQAILLLTNGQQAFVELGQAPKRTAGFIANNLLQWCFYYPAVLDPDELQFAAGEGKGLAESLAAYRSGDLLLALAKLPDGNPRSDPEKIYRAALFLAVGEVPETEAMLASLSANSERTLRLAGALKLLIAAVKRQSFVPTVAPKLASEFLATSYFEQSRAIRQVSLQNALHLAKRATTISPNFGFAWERVAELEFSFGNLHNAKADLDMSLALAPANAQALALRGFILASESKPREARLWFDRAIAADSALGNAWLGRGIARICLGDLNGGREDLLVAAALEPQRAELRSYLGKAYMAAGDDQHAAKELALAKRLDPNDPTAWLYSALFEQQQNQINDAIRDLEKSQSLNNNRSVYRSQLLLDQDQAVRSANLAGIYRDAGMFDVSVREAGRAVSSDYGNYSAHLFLANSYDQLRDPTWNNLRFDAPASDEFWIANLLAPTGAGWLAPIISHEPYNKLFDQNRFGVVSETTYLSRGAWMENADQYYASSSFSYDVGTSYFFDPGQRPNADFTSRELNVNLKGQLTAQDSLFAVVQLVKISSGDVNEYYNQSTASPDYRFNEIQKPNLFLGYHHEWSPGIHTLFLASSQYIDESAYTTNAEQNVAIINDGGIDGIRSFNAGENVGLQHEANSAELQQILEQANHTTILGTRYEWGQIRYQNLEWSTDASGLAAVLFPDPKMLVNQDFTENFQYFDIYGYHTWQIADPLAFTIGLSYDWLQQPIDVATPPFSNQEKATAQLSPKAGFIWNAAGNTTFRAAYSRALSGFGVGQNDRLEPTELAGFNQTFHSLIPESVVGDTSGSSFDIYQVSLEQKFSTGTYLALSGELLISHLQTLEGNFAYSADSSSNYSTYPSGLRKSFDYQEQSITLSVNQLLGNQWSAGARYRLSQANLELNYPDVPANAPPGNNDQTFQPNQNLNSVLQILNLHCNWNHPSGLFAILESNWYHQNNSGYTPAEPGDDFWQFNAYAGYRFWHRKAELSVGVLNVTGQDYQLEPLNLYDEMAHDRTFLVRFLLSF